MNRKSVAILLILLSTNAFAAQQTILSTDNVGQQRAKLNANSADIEARKADKDKTILDWSAHANGTTFAAKALVAYDGQIYKCLQSYTKNAGDTPAAFTSYWKTVGGVGSYDDLTDKPTLGTAAALDVGSTPGSVIQLDNEGKLPAVDASRVTGITGTIPAGSTTGQTVEWDATNNIWSPVDWNTLSADGNSLTISSGVLSVAGAAASANSTVLGRNALGVFGFNPISDYVSPTSGAVPIVQSADPISTDANGIYVATGSNKVFIKTDTGLVSWAATISVWDTTPDAWTFTAQTGLAVSTDVLSNSVTVAGINYQAPISASGSPGCGYSKNTLPCTSAAGTIVLGDTIKVCVTTSADPLATVTCTLASNGITAPFQATTAAAVSTWAIEDNFNDNTIANYTRINGTAVAAISNGAMYNTTGGGTTAWLQHQTNIGSSSQTVQAVLQDRIGSTSGASSGLLIRSNGTTGHGCWVDVGSNRFTCDALGGSGTAIYKSFTAGAWSADATHLVEISAGSDNIYHFKVDFNDDGDFLDAGEDVGASSANASYSGTYAGVGFRASGTTEKLDAFKAKVYAP